jgi:hypothetical protein
MSRIRQLFLVPELMGELDCSIVCLADNDENGERKNLFVTRCIEYIAFDLNISMAAACDSLDVEDGKNESQGVCVYNIFSKGFEVIHPCLFQGAVMVTASITPPLNEDEEWDDEDEDEDVQDVELSGESVEIEAYLVLSESAMPKWIPREAKEHLGNTSEDSHQILPALVYISGKTVNDIVLLANRI